MKIPHELAPMARAARHAGWQIEQTNGGHLRWVSPGGSVVISPLSPGTRNVVQKHKSELRRAGLDI